MRATTASSTTSVLGYSLLRQEREEKKWLICKRKKINEETEKEMESRR
jgi:hypothetical protein